MSKFKYMEFTTDGFSDLQFVTHAAKYTKEQTLQLYIERYYDRQRYTHRVPLMSDVASSSIRYYVKAPESLADEFDGGCYSFCNKGQRGSFNVWVIRFEDLEVAND